MTFLIFSKRPTYVPPFSVKKRTQFVNDKVLRLCFKWYTANLTRLISAIHRVVKAISGIGEWGATRNVGEMAEIRCPLPLCVEFQ